MSTGLATLRFIQQNNIPAHAAKMGARLRGHLSEIQKKHAFIGHLRGLGLMLGAKIVDPEKLAAMACRCRIPGARRGFSRRRSSAT